MPSQVNLCRGQGAAVESFRVSVVIAAETGDKAQARQRDDVTGPVDALSVVAAGRSPARRLWQVGVSNHEIS